MSENIFNNWSLEAHFDLILIKYGNYFIYVLILRHTSHLFLCDYVKRHTCLILSLPAFVSSKHQTFSASFYIVLFQNRIMSNQSKPSKF